MKEEEIHLEKIINLLTRFQAHWVFSNRKGILL